MNKYLEKIAGPYSQTISDFGKHYKEVWNRRSGINKIKGVSSTIGGILGGARGATSKDSKGKEKSTAAKISGGVIGAAIGAGLGYGASNILTEAKLGTRRYKSYRNVRNRSMRGGAAEDIKREQEYKRQQEWWENYEKEKAEKKRQRDAEWEQRRQEQDAKWQQHKENWERKRQEWQDHFSGFGGFRSHDGEGLAKEHFGIDLDQHSRKADVEKIMKVKLHKVHPDKISPDHPNYESAKAEATKKFAQMSAARDKIKESSGFQKLAAFNNIYIKEIFKL